VAQACFIGPKFCEEDRKLFEPSDTLLPFEAHETMAHLLARIGKFKSVSEARKNGWDKPVPLGWSEFRIGKTTNLLEVFIWNPEFTTEEFRAKYPES
jgi:hypothetical protein